MAGNEEVASKLKAVLGPFPPPPPPSPPLLHPVQAIDDANKIELKIALRMERPSRVGSCLIFLDSIGKEVFGGHQFGQGQLRPYPRQFAAASYRRYSRD
jgi:hypothetical protein